MWITAYELNAVRDAVRHREWYVRRDGLRWLAATAATRRATRPPARRVPDRTTVPS
ncbi:hypothetical protein [Micromonospora sp. NPDC092111]|uniref:hypothetical protein n=1 Tax=Micromonospora sp. NPDC092111 TaxID=3364289 RepID=UPI003816EC51